MVYCRPATFSVARLPKVFGCVMGRLSLCARISWRVGARDHGATAAPHAACATGYPQSITSADGRERSWREPLGDLILQRSSPPGAKARASVSYHELLRGPPRMRSS